MNILGISTCHLDKGACLLQEGQVVCAVQEEVFNHTGITRSFPFCSLKHCLQIGKIDIDNVDFIVFCDNPFVQGKRILMTSLAYAPIGIRSFLKDMIAWTTQQMWINKTIFKTSGFKGEILFAGRHESLAAEAFFQSPFPEAAFLTMDSGCERATAAYGVGSFNNLSVQAEQYFPHSLQFFYSAMLRQIGLKTDDAREFNEVASQGEAKYKKKILSNLMDLKADGSFKLNMNYFDYRTGFSVINKKLNGFLDSSNNQLASPGHQDKELARSVLEVIEEVVVRTVRHLQSETGQKKICVVGEGVMNCVNVKKIVSESCFDELYVQSASGGALGAVMHTWHEYLGRSQAVDLQNYAHQGMHRGADGLS